jgi:transcriptional regulator with XRE-family HTH domain
VRGRIGGPVAAGSKPALPAAFWDIPAVQDALDHGDLGALFTLILEHSGYSQHSLAAEVGMSQTQVWHYIHERHKPTLDTIAKVASRLEMPAKARLRLGLSAADHGSAPPKVRLSRVLALAEYIGRTGDTSGLASWRETASAGTSDDTWEQLSRLISAQSPASLRSTQRMSIRTRGFFTLAAKLPARLLIQALTAHVNDIGLLLDAIDDPGQRRELTSIGGEARLPGRVLRRGSR